MTSGLLGAISGAGGVGPFAQQVAGQPDWTQQALELAGNPHAGPYAGNLGTVPGFTGGSGTSGMTAGSTSGGSSGNSVVGGLLGTLSKNPSLVKNVGNAISGLFGTGLASYGSGAAADAAVTGELGSVGAQTAGEAAAIQAANDAALGGTAAGSGAAGSGAAGSSGAAAGLGAGGATALGLAAIPLALAAFVPHNSGFSIGDVNNMEQAVANATKANGGPIGFDYGFNPYGTNDQSKMTAANDLQTLLSDSSDEFTKAGGQDAVYQFLNNLGYGNLTNGMPGAITSPFGGRGGSARGLSRV